MRIRTCALLALGAALFACDADEQGNMASRYDSVGADGADAGADGTHGKHKDLEALLACVQPRIRTFSDGQIAAIVSETNAAEIALSEAVAAKLTDVNAKKLADEIGDAHKRSQAELDDLLSAASIQPAENPNSHHLSEMSALSLDALSEKTGAALDEGYVTHQLITHARVLGTLDHVLLPSATDPELKRYLQKVRKHVVIHTESIAAAQAKLLGAGDAGETAHDGGATIGPDVPLDPVEPADDVPTDPIGARDGGLVPPPGPVLLDAAVRR